jgi:hypothetical protein
MKNIFNSILKATLLALILLSSSIQMFAHFGPRTPLGGYATCTATNNGIVYWGTENGGVYESTNNQLVGWRPRPVGLITGKVTALTHSGSYLFAGTADGGVFIFNGFVGADRYWNKASNGLANMQIKSLVAVDSITVLAGTNGGGLFKTTDKGTTWTAVNDVNLNGAVISSLTKGGSRFFATSESGGVFASDNQGATWFSFNDAMTMQVSGTAALSYNDTTDVLMVLNANGLFAAPMAASTMSPAYAAASTGLPINTNVRGIANNGTNWYVATSLGVYQSSNGAFNWTASNTGLANVDAAAIVALPANVLVAVRKVGIYKSATTAITWAATNTGFNNPVTHSMAVSGDSLVIAVTDDGVYVSRKLGSPATTFLRSNNGLLDSTHVMDILIAKDKLFAATASGVFMSSDTGGMWMMVNQGLPNLNIHKLFYGNSQVYAIDGLGAIHTKDLGTGAWTSVQVGLPPNVMPTSMAFNGNRIIVGTHGDGVYMMNQHGTAWTSFNAGLSNLHVTSVASSANRFYAGTDGNGVFSTLADSAAWSATSQTSIAHTTMLGLDGDHIQAMNSYAGYVYASYQGGLLATSDEGQIWEAAGNQFNLPSFTNVHKVGFVATRVFALTDDNGPYANGLSELPVLANFLQLSDHQVMVPQAGRKDFVSVTSNVTWTLTSNQSWITVNPVGGFRDGTIEITTTANPGAMRTGQVTVSSDSIAVPLVIDVVQDGLVGIGQNPQMEMDFELAPNPNGGRFMVDFSALTVEASKLAILDLNGRLVGEWALEAAQKQIQLELNVAPGTYFARLQTTQGMLYKKLMIQ